MPGRHATRRIVWDFSPCEGLVWSIFPLGDITLIGAKT